MSSTHTIPVEAVVFDAKIYPRAVHSAATVDQYADALEAGDVFPPIILEPDTNRLFDGFHRWQAHEKLGRTDIEAVYREIPSGIPPKLFSASLSVKHGDRIKGEELRRIAREIVTAEESFNINTAAKYLGVSRQTAANWTRDIYDYRRDVRAVAACIMSTAGMTQQKIADHLEVSRELVGKNVNSDILTNLTESMLRDAIEKLPSGIDGESIAEEMRQQSMFATWTDEERDLVKRLREGETIVVTMREDRHANLIKWATDAELYERIDRHSDWGNPFVLDEDGDRDTVIDLYATHYLPYKKKLGRKVIKLKGKALGCWCYPDRCHGNVLADLASELGE